MFLLILSHIQAVQFSIKKMYNYVFNIIKIDVFFVTIIFVSFKRHNQNVTETSFNCDGSLLLALMLLFIFCDIYI
jgi:hypothetical protein